MDGSLESGTYACCETFMKIKERVTINMTFLVYFIQKATKASIASLDVVAVTHLLIMSS